MNLHVFLEYAERSFALSQNMQNNVNLQTKLNSVGNTWNDTVCIHQTHRMNYFYSLCKQNETVLIADDGKYLIRISWQILNIL
jgi:hypothetical protein